ncbi:hypothetical protein M0R04_12720 [Candidatus Dojkabacteria bacterium]|jgi:hypothetical protein|nr:hypothetical protein [Candidatus Dojkabacteria bacterium]
MKKKTKCEYCGGTGEVEVDVCDVCGASEKDVFIGRYKGKHICHSCYFDRLTDEEIKEL